MVTRPKSKINVQYYPSKTRDKCQYKCSHKLKVIFSARNGIGPITTFLKFQLCRLVSIISISEPGVTAVQLNTAKHEFQPLKHDAWASRFASSSGIMT